MNLIALLTKTKNHLQNYSEIDLFLDNDRAGKFCPESILKSFPGANDRSKIYEPDQGHYDKETKVWKPNYHAHLVADWQDLNTGKTLKHKSHHYSKMQDIAAESLDMERGVSGSHSRLEAVEFKIKKREEYLQILEGSTDKGY